MTSQAKIILASIALIGYIFLALFSLVGFSSHLMHSGMPMQDCPYAMGMHSLCTMDALGHIQGWEDAMRTLVALTLSIIIGVFFTVWLKIRKTGPLILLRRYQRQYSPYTILFARGILNPKIP